MTVPNKEIRRNIVNIVHSSGAAHLGTALSSVEILNVVFKSMDLEKIRSKSAERERIILSKGHGVAALYSVMNHHGLLSDELLASYSKNGSVLSGHANHFVEYVEHSTGALGHGLPVGLGIAIGLKSKGVNPPRVFVVVGDGELQEGSNWEAAMLAGYLKTGRLCVLVDNNGMGQIGKTEDSCSLEPLALKFKSFNFDVFEADGHDEDAILKIIRVTENSAKPVVIICRTVKGKGVSFMENNIAWHYRSPQGEDYDKALQELGTN